MPVDREKLTHGNLPHWYKPGFAHFVTYRLAGSIPMSKLKQWSQERQMLIRQSKAEDGRRDSLCFVQDLFFKKYDEYLDRNKNIRWLENEKVADAIRENLNHHHGKSYELIAWCIMPNHVHVLIQPFETQSVPVENSEHATEEIFEKGSILSQIMHSIKSYTANRANQILGRKGSFWQRESYDHWVRDDEELERIIDYIKLNPVNAGLCNRATDWKYSSAYERFKQDGSSCALVGRLRDDWRITNAKSR